MKTTDRPTLDTKTYAWPKRQKTTVSALKIIATRQTRINALDQVQCIENPYLDRLGIREDPSFKMAWVVPQEGINALDQFQCIAKVYNNPTTNQCTD